ncbi:hypothetical protein GCM10010486_28540 [Nonomuraea roseoviolacea subsp. carminata]
MLSLYWLHSPTWVGQMLDTALRIICAPRILVDREQAGSDTCVTSAEQAERELLAAGFHHNEMRSFGLAGVSLGYASWSGVASPARRRTLSRRGRAGRMRASGHRRLGRTASGSTARSSRGTTLPSPTGTGGDSCGRSDLDSPTPGRGKPPYAPDLNPVEGIWSLLRRGWLSNVAFSTPEHLVQRIRRGLRHIQYRSELIDGCLAETGLAIRPT